MAFTYKGKTIEELKKMSLKEFAELVDARQRRSLKRGLSEEKKQLLEKIREEASSKSKKPVKTHLRDMIIIPEMIDQTIYIHNGKVFLPITISIKMLGHYLGEFVLTRGKVKHSAPGIGATRSSAAVSVK